MVVTPERNLDFGVKRLPEIRNRAWILTAARIRTVGFVLAMIPMVLAVAMVGLLSLLALSPLIAYARFRGKHLKDPWGKAKLLP